MQPYLRRCPTLAHVLSMQRFINYYLHEYKDIDTCGYSKGTLIDREVRDCGSHAIIDWMHIT